MKQNFRFLVFALACIVMSARESCTAEGTKSHRPTLSVVRQQIESRERGEGPRDISIGDVSLAAYDYHLETRIGPDLTLIIVVCDRTGGLLLFDREGTQVANIATSRIVETRFLDLDDDDTPEILLHTVSTGTGLRMDEYVLFRLGNDSASVVWSKEAYIMDGDSTRWPEPEKRETAVIFSPFSFGKAAHLTCISYDYNRKTYARSYFDVDDTGRVSRRRTAKIR